MEAIPHPIPRTVEEVFSDFKGRRSGLIKALTTGLFFFYYYYFWTNLASFLCFISIFA
jgi:hypothetical protein